MTRREFIAGLGGAAVWPLAAYAQQRSVPVIGVLFGGRLDAFRGGLAAFRQGLAEAGFVVDKNVVLETRAGGADLQFGRLAALAADLVQRHVDVIFAVGPIGPIYAAKSATTTIPIVFFYGGDPVKDGLVQSLAHPGGNVTGVTDQTTELAGKRLDLLHELVPGVTTIGFLTGGGNFAGTVPVEIEPLGLPPDNGVVAGARILRLDVIAGRIGSDGDLERAFSTFAEGGVGALVVDDIATLANYMGAIISLAERYKMPAMYPGKDWVRAGGLIGYGASSRLFNYVRLVGAQYVGPILKGIMPADLPVQQPVSFESAINLKTAKALGLTIPPNLLAVADEVVE
jgi:putative tryptophan/tyrosine transport system substrate-binding protein